jgi:hypothetical protein
MQMRSKGGAAKTCGVQAACTHGLIASLLPNSQFRPAASHELPCMLGGQLMHGPAHPQQPAHWCRQPPTRHTCPGRRQVGGCEAAGGVGWDDKGPAQDPRESSGGQ